MRRNATAVFATVAAAAAIAAALLGLVMTRDADFARTYTAEQLSRQRITFAPVDALTRQEKQSSCLVEYAGQQLTTGKQAECYANDFIGLHVKEVAEGRTYAELRGPERELFAQLTAARAANDPAVGELQKQHTILKAQRDALFQGETSRGLLLTALGFSVLGAKAQQAATAAFGIALVLALISAFSIARVIGRRAPQATSSSTVDVDEIKVSERHQLVEA